MFACVLDLSVGSDAVRMSTNKAAMAWSVQKGDPDAANAVTRDEADA